MTTYNLIALLSFIMINTICISQKEFETKLTGKGLKTIKKLINKYDCAPNLLITYTPNEADEKSAILVLHMPVCNEFLYKFEMKQLARNILFKGLKSNKQYSEVRIVDHKGKKYNWVKNDPDFNI